jgi:hypothetical protein
VNVLAHEGLAASLVADVQNSDDPPVEVQRGCEDPRGGGARHELGELARLAGIVDEVGLAVLVDGVRERIVAGDDVREPVSAGKSVLRGQPEAAARLDEIERRLRRADLLHEEVEHLFLY